MSAPEDVQAAVRRAKRILEPPFVGVDEYGTRPERIAKDILALASRLSAETARADVAEEVVEAARAYRVVRPAFWDGDGHAENDEISCSCGFVSQASSYKGARKSLERHISAKIKADAEIRERTVSQFDAALARYDSAKEKNA